MINASSELSGVTKYIGPTKKALENRGAYLLKNAAGEMVGATTVSKRFEGNNTVQSQTVRHLKDGRFIQQTRYEYGNGSVASYTLKDNKVKGKEPFISIVTKMVNKDGESKVVHKVTRDGDRFSAKIDAFKPIDGKYQPVTQIYDTKPSDVKGVINPNEYTQEYLIRTAKDGFFTRG